ncbi:MAG: ABC transporter ATP-binding protein, partial [Candidatus Izemoplasmatales bacterium]|nr:ABC transporter ATP-binding protein [Candidatus Izemoplasmatales bacterium]
MTLSLPENGMLFVVGKSGAGKSTLLNLMGGLDQPTSGKIILHGIDLTTNKHRRLTSYIRHLIGFVFQDYSLVEDMDVYDNLNLAISHLGLCRDTIEKRISNALDEVDLSGCNHRKITELSGGEQQRVAIARAIVKDASIILCDEPTGNLDLENAARCLDILKGLSKDKLIVVVTHNEILANQYADRMIRLEEGIVVQDSRISETNLEKVKEVSNSNDEKPVKRKAFSFFNHISMKLLWMDYKKHFFSTIISIFVFCVSISLFLSFSAVSKYSSYDTFVDTLEYNDQYLVKVTTYIDNSIFVGDQLYMYGLFPTYELVDEEDSTTVEELTGNLLNSYKSYYFLKNFQDFLDYRLEADEYGSYPSCAYRTSYFTDMIIIEDFSGFNQPFLYGSYPKADNEIIIYDFMAFQLLETNALTSVARMEDLIDYVLTDKDTGFEMKIVGILQTDYEKYVYTDGQKSIRYPFESLYLSEMQSIFTLPGFLDLVKNDTEMISINSISVYNGSQRETSDDIYVRKVQLVHNIDSFDFIVEPAVDESEGIILSNYQLADLLDMNVS